MLFNSLDFAIFLPIVFFLYWVVAGKRHTLQNLILLFAGYVFYGWWDWRFLGLIAFSTVLDYTLGRALGKEQNDAKRKALIFLSIAVNLGFLGYFKYFNFFVDSFIAAFSIMGIKFQARTLNVILPVGISFYTFQSLSYTIDVYRRKLEPAKSFLDFCAFVCFFPQLVAGPIERATHMLPQFYLERKFSYSKAVDGCRQMLWGLFKKIVIADNCAEHANIIFNNSGSYSGSTLALGALLFTIQIYGDFSGYSDIATGTAKLFGFDLVRNFAFPYFSRDIAEFWRRWHMSLSTWFRDYLYVPLGGSRGGTWSKIRNTFIVFLVSGFWHGANWTFVIWGLLNAVYFIPLLLLNRNRDNLGTIAEGKFFPSFRELVGMLSTFTLTLIAWVFFRASDVQHAIQYLKGMFSRTLLSVPEILPVQTLLLVAVFMLIEWIGRENQHALEKLGSQWARPVRWGLYFVIITSISSMGGQQQQFIYFQF